MRIKLQNDYIKMFMLYYILKIQITKPSHQNHINTI